MNPPEVFLCRHEKCSKLVKADRKRFLYTSSNGRLVHERHPEYHNCPDTCKRCERLKDKWIVVERKGNLKCRHSDCSHRYIHKESRSKHETSVPHYCKATCQRCGDLRKKQVSQEIARQQQEERRQWLDQKQYEQDYLFRQCAQVASELLAKYKETENVPAPEEYARQLSLIFQEELLKTTKVQSDIRPLQTVSSQPTVKQLLSFKDSLQIPDHKWDLVMSTFKLEANASIYQLRNLRTIVQEILPTRPTAANGYQIAILAFLQWILTKKPPVGGNEKRIPLKFCFDNGTMTSEKRIGQELGAFELIQEGQTMAKVKSPSNCHVWLLYFGSKDREELEKEVAGGVEAINYLIQGGTVEAGGKEWKFEPILVCDMKALVRVQGLYDCFNPKAYWKCPWCKVCKHDVFDFKIKKWPFRDATEIQQLEEKIPEKPTAKKRFQKEYFGINNKRLFQFSANHIIPCSLHLGMAVTRKLLDLLAQEAAWFPSLSKEWEQILEDRCKLKLPPATSGGNRYSFLDRIRKARFTHPDYLKILKSRSYLLDALLQHVQGPEQQERVRNIRIVWEQFFELSSLIAQARVMITEEEWLTKARRFGEAFLQVYCAEQVTPYIHVLVYHVGFFLEHYHGIEKFANYALEGMIAVTKRNLSSATAGFSQGRQVTAQQQLNVLLRKEVHMAKACTDQPERPLKRPKRNWAQETITAMSADVAKHVVSPTVT